MKTIENLDLQVLGVTDQVHECDRCGRNDLEKTVVILADGETYFLGSSCAAHKFEFASKSKVDSFVKKQIQSLKHKMNNEISEATSMLSDMMAECFRDDKMDEFERLDKKVNQIKTDIKNRYQYL